MYMLTVPHRLQDDLENFHDAFEGFFLQQNGFKYFEKSQSNSQLKHTSRTTFRE